MATNQPSPATFQIAAFRTVLAKAGIPADTAAQLGAAVEGKEAPVAAILEKRRDPKTPCAAVGRQRKPLPLHSQAHINAVIASRVRRERMRKLVEDAVQTNVDGKMWRGMGLGIKIKKRKGNSWKVEREQSTVGQ